MREVPRHRQVPSSSLTPQHALPRALVQVPIEETLFDGCRVRQVYPVARVRQSVHQPVPVVGALDDHPREFVAIRLECRSDLREFIGQALLVHDAVLVIADNHHAVVRVQVYATIVHVGLPKGQSEYAN